MPRVSDQIRYTVQQIGSDHADGYISEPNTTLEDVLRDELVVNPSKVTVFINGNMESNLQRTINEGDAIRLAPKNYDSGR